MEDITIRQAAVLDVEGILECLRLAFAPYRSAYTAAAFEDTVLTRESLLGRLQSMTVLVALNHSGGVIGTLAFRVAGQEAHLRGMAVLPEYQSHGIAGKLLERAEAELADASCSRITLDTTEPLERAMRFYERRGFRRSGKVRDFFGMTLIEYVKVLDPEK